MREVPRPYEIYRHFKGNLYQVLAIAKDSEDASQKVVYQALYEPFEIYVRDLSMFMSPVDKAKYPQAAQENRFERIGVQKTENVNNTKFFEENYDRQEKPEDLDEDEALNPLLLQFLDSDTYEEKLNILVAMHETIDQDMINTIAMALDIEVAPGDVEERYEQVKNCLITFEKYECNRLR